MKTFIRSTFAAAALAMLVPIVAQAQTADVPQYFRPYDQRGISMFEAPKEAGVPYQGFRVFWGASFTQQFQALDHENAASPNVVNDVDQNALMDIGAGFNLATANLHLAAQLAEGIQVNLTTYLSSRHHPEAWVKGGYVQIDAAPMFQIEALDRLMEFTTVRVGHFEINYGDAHFRRSDNGNAMYNPFVGNLIMDAFTTEIGGEVYFRKDGLMAMVAMTGGEIQGSVLRPDDRAPSFYGKLGFDRQLNEDLRVRLTGSLYTTDRSLNNTLYSGDRAGSRYYFVMENTQASAAGNFTSGRFNPGLRSNVTAMVVNPWVKFNGLELFGNFERAEGAAANETQDRSWTQTAVEGIYRFFPDEALYVGARYNQVSGELAGSGDDVSIDRIQIGGGWFITPRVLMKAEYVTQNYNDFAASNRFHEGKFNGLIMEGVISF
jgi:hypothetical protein